MFSKLDALPPQKTSNLEELQPPQPLQARENPELLKKNDSSSTSLGLPPGFVPAFTPEEQAAFDKILENAEKNKETYGPY